MTRRAESENVMEKVDTFFVAYVCFDSCDDFCGIFETLETAKESWKLTSAPYNVTFEQSKTSVDVLYIQIAGKTVGFITRMAIENKPRNMSAL